MLAARATVFPDWPEGGEFREEVVLSDPEADRFGTTVEASGGTVVADFHARRPLRSMTVVPAPAGLNVANLYVDLGGTWL